MKFLNILKQIFRSAEATAELGKIIQRGAYAPKDDQPKPLRKPIPRKPVGKQSRPGVK